MDDEITPDLLKCPPKISTGGCCADSKISTEVCAVECRCYRVLVLPGLQVGLAEGLGQPLSRAVKVCLALYVEGGLLDPGGQSGLCQGSWAFCPESVVSDARVSWSGIVDLIDTVKLVDVEFVEERKAVGHEAVVCSPRLDPWVGQRYSFICVVLRVKSCQKSLGLG